MWGDYQVDDPNTLTQAQKDKLINQAKLIAGITAVFAGEDVNVAAGVAAEAVQNNALVKSDDIKNFYLHYNTFCSSGSSAACDAIIHQWKYVSYEHAGMTSQEIVAWENSVTQIIEHYNRQCKDNTCRNHLRSQKYRYMIEHAGTPEYLYQLESSLITYIHGPMAAVTAAGHQISGSVVEAYNAVSRQSVRGGSRTQVNNSAKAQKPLSNTSSNYQQTNKKAVEDLRQGVFPGKGEIGQPREMQKSTDPNKAADDFAQQFLGRKPTTDDYKQGATMNNNNCQGCWRAQTPDGTWVIYRPAGKAGKDTLPTTATVEVNSKNIKGANKNAQLKLKFPKE